MGGSGGGFFYENSSPPENISKKVRDQEERSQNNAFETEVNGMLRSQLSEVNNRDTDQIQQHLNTIEDAVHSEIEGFIDLKYAG